MPFSQKSDITEMESLKLENEYLTRKLDQVSCENVQSAKYGLELLKEKQDIERKFIELEVLYENMKFDFEAVRKAYTKLQTSQRITTEDSIHQEDKILNESVIKERSFMKQIYELQSDIKLLQQELNMEVFRNGRLIQENSEIVSEKLKIENEVIRLKNEIGDLKAIELNLQNNCEEIENENVLLQREIVTVMCLKKDLQVANSEIKHLMQENLNLQEYLNELQNAKRIFEVRLEETLETLEIERENRIALQNEMRRDMIYKNKSLAESIIEVEQSDHFTTAGGLRANSTVDLKNSNYSIASSSKDVIHERNVIEKKSENQKIDVIDCSAIEKEILNNGSYEFKTSMPELCKKTHFNSMLNLKNGYLKTINSTKNKEVLENLKLTKENLKNLNTDLNQFYDKIYKIKRQSAEQNLEGFENFYQNSKNLTEFSLQSKSSNEVELLHYSNDVKKLSDFINEYFNSFKVFVQEILLEKCPSDNNVKHDTSDDLTKQIIKLEKLLKKKQKKIASLQTTLNSDRKKAGKALVEIRGKYDKERRAIGETISTLEKELETSKEEATVFEGLREKFTNRCTQYMTNIDILKKELRIVKEEKDLLHRILTTSVRQKVNVQEQGQSSSRNEKKTKKRVQFNMNKNLYKIAF